MLKKELTTDEWFTLRNRNRVSKLEIQKAEMEQYDSLQISVPELGICMEFKPDYIEENGKFFIKFNAFDIIGEEKWKAGEYSFSESTRLYDTLFEGDVVSVFEAIETNKVIIVARKNKTATEEEEYEVLAVNEIFKKEKNNEYQN